MNLQDMDKDERSLLLFFETCAVDSGGKIDARRMNADDFAKARNWNEAGFIKFGRIRFKDIDGPLTHWCKLSEEAWKLAHEERRARCKRTMSKNVFRKTKGN